MESWIITIDGPAGVGKSTAARMLAKRLGAVFLDTGATYRAVTLAAMRVGAELTDPQAVLDVMGKTRFEFFHAGDVLKVVINGQDETAAIRSPEVTENVRHIASQPMLRTELVKVQQDFAAQFEKIVTEGRDQGTVAFPDAKFKFFLTANPAERARRRHDELNAAGRAVDFEMLTRQIIERDASDENRSVGPLKPAADAIVMDTTTLDAAGVVERMLKIITQQTDQQSV